MLNKLHLGRGKQSYNSLCFGMVFDFLPKQYRVGLEFFGCVQGLTLYKQSQFMVLEKNIVKEIQEMFKLRPQFHWEV